MSARARRYFVHVAIFGREISIPEQHPRATLILAENSDEMSDSLNIVSFFFSFSFVRCRMHGCRFALRVQVDRVTPV